MYKYIYIYKYIFICIVLHTTLVTAKSCTDKFWQVERDRIFSGPIQLYD